MGKRREFGSGFIDLVLKKVGTMQMSSRNAHGVNGEECVQLIDAK